MTAETLNWWTLLCSVSVLNVLAWLGSAMLLKQRRVALHPQAWAFGRMQLLLSAGYVLGCAYRSALPVFDVQRLCLVDTWFSSVVVGRSVATLAELCFAAQWAVLLRGAAVAAGSPLGLVTSRIVLPLIATAEACSWNAVLTTSNLGHVLEESIWGLTAAMIVLSLQHIGARADRSTRRLLTLCSALGIAYVVYIFAVDVPMYWARWVADEAQGRQYLTLAQGMLDASTRWVVTHRWDDWKSEVVWMSLYFSVAVWLSIGLIHAPVVHRDRHVL